MMARYIIFIISLFYIFTIPCSAAESITILLDFQQGKKIIYLDGNVLKQKNMYDALRKPFYEKGRNSEVSVLFNSKLSFSELIDIRGLLQKIGFTDIRLYCLSDDKEKMVEIEINKPAVVVPIYSKLNP